MWCSTLDILMNPSIWFDTMSQGWFIVYIKGSQVGISKLRHTPVPEYFFILANSKDPDEMPHNVAFHLGLHCLPKYMFRAFLSTQIFKLSAKIRTKKQLTVPVSHVAGSDHLFRPCSSCGHTEHLTTEYPK